MIRVAMDVAVSQGAFRLRVTDEASVEVLGLFGPSGSGKTTLLETLAGLRRPSSGEIRVGDRVLFSSTAGIDVPPHARRIGYVPQDVLLFPHLSVRGNIEYAARSAAYLPRTNLLRTQNLKIGPTPILGIDALLDRRVTDLSGGEKPRVAIARALAASPELLLLDDPLAAVDREHRDRILPYLLRIRRELHVPMIYVTHDEDELRQIADRVIVISAGRVQRAGAPDAVWPAAAP
jgi:molybdate transport system ATP-binding protein